MFCCLETYSYVCFLVIHLFTSHIKYGGCNKLCSRKFSRAVREPSDFYPANWKWVTHHVVFTFIAVWLSLIHSLSNLLWLIFNFRNWRDFEVCNIFKILKLSVIIKHCVIYVYNQFIKINCIYKTWLENIKKRNQY